jgi:hypothetical protein
VTRRYPAHGDEPEDGLFVKLDRGGWVTIRAAGPQAPPWDELVGEWIGRVQLEPDAEAG